jgi:hypothetical protein
MGTSTRYKHLRLHKYLEITFYLNYTHAVNSSKSQNQTCTTIYSMDNRTGKHSAKVLRTDAQRTMANIHIDRVEKLLLSGIFLLLLSVTEE